MGKESLCIKSTDAWYAWDMETRVAEATAASCPTTAGESF